MRASYNSYFLEIAEKEYSDHDRLIAIIGDDWQVRGIYMDECIALEKLYFKVIIFLACYLESYIWNAGAEYLGENEMAKLDKLATPDKWEIIPRLVLKSEFKIRPHQIDYLKRLFKERNKLMHNKSIEVGKYFRMNDPVRPVPDELLSIWIRVNLKHFFAVCDYLPKALESAIETAQIYKYPY
jgi:hypothetical protein